MREIKFRGKDAAGIWQYGDLVKSKQGMVFILFEGLDDKLPLDPTDFMEVDPKTVGQLTGLKDKNGVEIYEGDVVEADHEDGKILFKNISLFAKKSLLGDLVTLFGDYTTTKWIEVIGNIHDNPELIR